MSNHTSKPYHIEEIYPGVYSICSQSAHKLIFITKDDDSKKALIDAEFIVKACNNHNALVNVLKQYASDQNIWADDEFGDDGYHCIHCGKEYKFADDEIETPFNSLSCKNPHCKVSIARQVLNQVKGE